MFIEQVIEQLEKMSEAEKDEWILIQARLLGEYRQQSFLFVFWLMHKKEKIMISTKNCITVRRKGAGQTLIESTRR
ncbi:MAG: hypothetical protein GX815_13290 [Clostridiales bacterium]|nr:hypothetical protein [Clostridiales bacterium]